MLPINLGGTSNSACNFPSPVPFWWCDFQRGKQSMELIIPWRPLCYTDNRTETVTLINQINQNKSLFFYYQQLSKFLWMLKKSLISTSYKYAIIYFLG